jgi:hypothetical protein
MPPRHAALGAGLMCPRRAAWPPAAPGGSARCTIGAVAHRGEDPPDDRGITADSVQRGVIIWRPASRSRFGGLALDDLDDVEDSHMRHDPPSPLARSGREPLPPPRPPGPHVARPGPATGDGRERIFPLLVRSRQCGSKYQIEPLRSAVPRGDPHPTNRLFGARRRVARGDGRQGEVDARHHVEWWSRSERTGVDPPLCAARCA